jgi:two-component sensor histidine kinase
MAGPTAPQEFLKAENVGLRMLLEQASIDAQALLAQAGIDAEQRETADKLQKLIVEELHHRIKNTLATVSAIASQSLRTATDLEHGQQAIESRLLALGRAPRSVAAGAVVERQPRADRPGGDRAL